MNLEQHLEAKLWEIGEITGDEMIGAKKAAKVFSKMMNLPPIGNVVILPATLDSKFTVGDGELKTSLNVEATDQFLVELNRIKNCAVCIVAVEHLEDDLLPSNGDDPNSPPIAEPKPKRGRPRKSSES